MNFRKIIALICAVFMPLSAAAGQIAAADDLSENSLTESVTMNKITIDGSTVNTSENNVWRGFGTVSANNSSRLLLDYKAEQPDEYDRLLKLMFDPDGPLKMSHLKIEMGADINSSSGTEPSTMRTADEKADVTRGAGFQLAADAKKINPDLTLELLSWGAPAFVKNAADTDEKNELRYLWFRDTLKAAYDTYGLEFDYIDPNINEKVVDSAWIKYFAKRLDEEEELYESGKKIKIVIADEECRYNAANLMLRDKELMDAVDAVGIHYTSTSDENTLKLKSEYGKELFYSEGISPCEVSRYAVNADGSGISGVNSALDVAGRIVNMYPNGGFTMYEFQPVISAYYSGATYFPKQLITANEPWSGYTEIDSGVYMAQHFSLFSSPGWLPVDSACFGDGREETHVLYDTTNNYLTLTDPDSGDYSTVYVNNSASERSYKVKVSALKKASSPVQVWETRGPDENGEYDSNYLRNIMSVTPEKDGDVYTYQITVKPYSMITVTTLDASPEPLASDIPCKRLALPYSDDFEYEDMPEDYLSSRGGAPRYTTDQGGAFEVVSDSKRGNVLEQKITDSLRGIEWGATPDPVTTLGDDTWANYTASADVKLAAPDSTLKAEDNYAGVGARYINSSAKKAKSGYSIMLFGDGSWKLYRLDELLEKGSLEQFDPDEWHNLSITAVGDTVSAAIDGVQVVSKTQKGEVTFSGRIALYSAYANNRFDDINVMPTENTNYINRLDQLDDSLSYSGNWTHNVMDSFTCHNRTSSQTSDGSLEFSFEGDSLALIGTAKKASLTVEIDGEVISDGSEELSCSNDKAAFWHRYSLGYSNHTAKITVNSGSIKLDAIEYGSNTENKDGTGEDISVLSDSAPDSEPKKLRSKAGAAVPAVCAAVLICAAAVYAAVRAMRKKRTEETHE